MGIVGLLLLIILLVILFQHPGARSYGYGPPSLVTVLIIVLIVLLVTNVVPVWWR